MLKRTMTAADHTALTPALQALYVAAADGNGFTLDVDADPALRALASAGRRVPRKQRHADAADGGTAGAAATAA